MRRKDVIFGLTTFVAVGCLGAGIWGGSSPFFALGLFFFAIGVLIDQEMQ